MYFFNFLWWICTVCLFCFCFLRRSFPLVAQDGVQWYNLGWLQPQPPRFKQFSCISFPGNWDYRTTPPCPVDFFVFSRDGVSPYLVEMGFHHVDQDGLDLLTLWSTHLGLPKCWDYRLEPPCLAHLHSYEWLHNSKFNGWIFLPSSYLFIPFFCWQLFIVLTLF